VRNLLSLNRSSPLPYFSQHASMPHHLVSFRFVGMLRHLPIFSSDRTNLTCKKNAPTMAWCWFAFPLPNQSCALPLPTISSKIGNWLRHPTPSPDLLLPPTASSSLGDQKASINLLREEKRSICIISSSVVLSHSREPQLCIWETVNLLWLEYQLPREPSSSPSNLMFLQRGPYFYLQGFSFRKLICWMIF
jgi:hypothetical protein